MEEDLQSEARPPLTVLPSSTKERIYQRASASMLIMAGLGSALCGSLAGLAKGPQDIVVGALAGAVGGAVCGMISGVSCGILGDVFGKAIGWPLAGATGAAGGAVVYVLAEGIPESIIAAPIIGGVFGGISGAITGSVCGGMSLWAEPAPSRTVSYKTGKALVLSLVLFLGISAIIVVILLGSRE
jgi:hypothetical protein